jgi:hypothetical protein
MPNVCVRKLVDGFSCTASFDLFSDPKEDVYSINNNNKGMNKIINVNRKKNNNNRKSFRIKKVKKLFVLAAKFCASKYLGFV